MAPLVVVDRSEVRDGTLEELRVAIGELVAFVEDNEPRPLSYDVYFSEGGRHMTVVQVHPDSASMEHHMRVAAGAFPGFAELLVLTSMDVYGEPSAGLIEQIRRKVAMLGSATVTVHRRHSGFARVRDPVSRPPGGGRCGCVLSRVLAPAPRLPETEQVFDSCVLGVDPGLSMLGLAAVARRDRRPELLWAGTVRTPGDLAEPDRLRQVHLAVREAISTHCPEAVAVERVAWNKNQRSALHVARATGVILLAASEAGLGVAEYGPLEVKMAVTGQGNASKGQVREALERLHGLREVPTQADAADAVAVALCHLTQARLRRAVGEARQSRTVDLTRLRA